jgi:signal transduction histidine kinase
MKTLEEKDQLYRQFVEEEQGRAAMTLVSLGTLLFPIFSFLDFFTQRDHFQNLTIIRFSTVAIYLIVLFLLRNGFLKSKPFLTGSFLLIVGATSISIMCASLEGSGSPYYGGVNLVLLAGVMILPGEGFQNIIWIAISLFAYVISILWVEGFTVLHPQIFINNMFFMGSTAFIGIISGFLRSKLRKKSYFQVLEIQKTSRLLSEDLHSKHSNLESLAEEIVQKKIEVQSALDLRNSFISIASHELKTPLTALKLQLEMAKMREVHGELNLKVFVSTLDNQILRINLMIDDMLDVSRLQTGKFSLQPQKMDISQLINEMTNRYYELLISEKKLILDIEPNLWGEWDSFKVEQVILNLLSNAFRYGLNRPVLLTAGEGLGSVIITVEDQGMGIATEDKSRIFEKFERGPTKNISGLGLGLFICKEIILAHRGHIFLESELGKGSVFKVVLPTQVS